MSQCFQLIFKRPWRKNEIFTQLVHIGIGSLPIIVVSTAFAGLVISDQMAWHMNEAVHTLSMIPGFTGQFIMREIGIAIPAMLLVSKVGASITAEVGTMKITEQIDALTLLRIDPIAYIVFPRWIATILSLLCLTIIAVAVTLSCAISIAVLKYDFMLGEYLNMLRHFISSKDLLCAAAKSITFGSVIPVISCAYGFNCRGGAQGVGEATTNSVVMSTMAIIVLDFMLTYLFTLIL